MHNLALDDTGVTGTRNVIVNEVNWRFGLFTMDLQIQFLSFLCYWCSVIDCMGDRNPVCSCRKSTLFI